MRSEDRRPAIDVGSRIVRWMVGLDPLSEDDAGKLRQDWRNLLYPEPPEDTLIDAMWRDVVDTRARIVTGSTQNGR